MLFLEALGFAAHLTLAGITALETQSPSDQDSWLGVLTALQGYGTSE